MYYYSEPRIFKAIQYDGTNLEEIVRFNDKVPEKRISNDRLFFTNENGQLMMRTLGCNWPFNVGDYVSLGRDQLKPIEKDLFESLYHTVKDHQPRLVFDISAVWSDGNQELNSASDDKEEGEEPENMYDYAYYLGEGGWGCVDDLYLIKLDGFVKYIRNASKHIKFSKDIKYMSDEMLNCGGLRFNIGGIEKSSVENVPETVCGMDGVMVFAYKFYGNNIKKIWNIEDYGQIPNLRKIMGKMQHVKDNIVRKYGIEKYLKMTR